MCCFGPTIPRQPPPPPELEKDTERADWPSQRVVDPQQQERDDKAMRGMRMNLRRLCLKLLQNRRFKDFHFPVTEVEGMPSSVKEAYVRAIQKPMDLATVLHLIDKKEVRCKSHFMQQVELIAQNALRFNGPDGPEAQKAAEEAEAASAPPANPIPPAGDDDAAGGGGRPGAPRRAVRGRWWWGAWWRRTSRTP